MHSTKQSFLQYQTRHLGVVLLLDVRDSRQDAMRLRGEANMRGLQWLAQGAASSFGIAECGMDSGQTSNNTAGVTRPYFSGAARSGRRESAGREQIISGGLAFRFQALEVVVQRLDAVDARVLDLALANLQQRPAGNSCGDFGRREIAALKGLDHVFVHGFWHD